jgi:hypothetical protein
MLLPIIEKLSLNFIITGNKILILSKGQLKNLQKKLQCHLLQRKILRSKVQVPIRRDLNVPVVGRVPERTVPVHTVSRFT